MAPERYQGEILSRLLDKYERSGCYKNQTAPARRIMLKLYDGGLSDFPPYDIEKPETRERINRSVLALHGQGLVFYQWMRGEENHILARVWLNAENAAAAYAFINRRPSGDIAEEVCAELREARQTVSSPWIRNFFDDSLQAISRRRSVGKGGVVPAEREARRDLLRALVFADSRLFSGPGESELLERVFSIRCFGDSKKFETGVKNRFLEILRRYADFDDDAAGSDEELLRFAGITRYPEQFEFRGPLTLSFAAVSNAVGDDTVKTDGVGTGVDFSPLIFGASVNSTDLKRGALSLPPDLTRILSIENRANYIDYIYRKKETRELVIYHGGQYSPARGLFFKALAAAMPEGCPWYHWGDIDYGGFSMLARLRREIKRGALPYRMDEAELRAYRTFTLRPPPAYLEKLKTLADREELADCAPCIAYMIKEGLRLEQEAMLTDGEEETTLRHESS
ncbi:MAG: DUF2220 domain-containing protein [Treponema sp.]|jgi:hypothetical protein|nr:DUF2220 domain-containing protein [Treponema sp.]